MRNEVFCFDFQSLFFFFLNHGSKSEIWLATECHCNSQLLCGLLALIILLFFIVVRKQQNLIYMPHCKFFTFWPHECCLKFLYLYLGDPQLVASRFSFSQRSPGEPVKNWSPSFILNLSNAPEDGLRNLSVSLLSWAILDKISLSLVQGMNGLWGLLVVCSRRMTIFNSFHSWKFPFLIPPQEMTGLFLHLKKTKAIQEVFLIFSSVYLRNMFLGIIFL